MSVILDLQVASDAAPLPTALQLQEWVTLILSDRVNSAELTIRIVDEKESTYLQNKYCRKQGPTNVLSFPVEIDPQFNSSLLGDIIICAPVIAKEAVSYNKGLWAHWAHMVAHGTLHLLGYTHDSTPEAEVMERIETEILIKLGYPPPYSEYMANT